jgi:triosephosphate isomerase
MISGNWKMNLDKARCVELAQAVVEQAGRETSFDVVLCPPFPYLDCVGSTIRGTTVALGAQNVYFEPDGAFTGETSTTMLRDLACRYVILGHSERRHILGESDEVVNRKVRGALADGLTPIVCVGELLAEREAGITSQVVGQQLDQSLAGLSAEQLRSIVLAYEPVWAIGTGKTATPEVAQAVHSDLRNSLAKRYNAAVADEVRILYGGSVKAANAAQLLAQKDIDGALVGGASLVADEFLGIVAAGRKA